MRFFMAIVDLSNTSKERIGKNQTPPKHIALVMYLSIPLNLSQPLTPSSVPLSKPFHTLLIYSLFFNNNQEQSFCCSQRYFTERINKLYVGSNVFKKGVSNMLSMLRNFQPSNNTILCQKLAKLIDSTIHSVPTLNLSSFI